jgi:hypothetical protein
MTPLALQFIHEISGDPKVFCPMWIIILSHEELKKPCCGPCFVTHSFTSNKTITLFHPLSHPWNQGAWRQVKLFFVNTSTPTTCSLHKQHELLKAQQNIYRYLETIINLCTSPCMERNWKKMGQMSCMLPSLHHQSLKTILLIW